MQAYDEILSCGSGPYAMPLVQLQGLQPYLLRSFICSSMLSLACKQTIRRCGGLGIILTQYQDKVMRTAMEQISLLCTWQQKLHIATSAAQTIICRFLTCDC